jgi:RNA polymerase-binding transcription factor DksA
MNEEDKKKLQTKLEEELKLLESELKSIGRRNPSNPDDWEATQGDAITGGADRNESADGIEQYEEHSAILKELETRYNNVKLALEKISNGNYGICEIGGEQIEFDRLNANPAARTCKAHIEETPGE